MSGFEHSAERDEELFEQIEYSRRWGHGKVDFELADEIMAVAKKWRAKANMRAARIEELEAELAFERTKDD